MSDPDFGTITWELARLSEQLTTTTTGDDSELSYVQNMINRFNAEYDNAMRLAVEWNRQDVINLLNQIKAAGESRYNAWYQLWLAAKETNQYVPPPGGNPTPAPRFGLNPYNYEDYIVDFGAIPISEEETNRLFIDDIGGLELAQIATMNTIGGNNRAYTLISGLEKVDLEGDPLRLISSQTPDASYFNSLSMDFEDYFEESVSNPTIDSDGNIVIDFISWDTALLLEIEIDSGGTIYEMDEAV